MLLQVVSLKKDYGKLTAVNTIDFGVNKGEIVGLLGPNGAGKSTTISMISTLIKPTAGQILYKSEDIVKKPKAIQAHLGIVPQEVALYPTLTGMDNMKFWGKAYGLKGPALKKRIEEVSDIIGIKERLKDRVDKYSGGMKRRLNIGVALLHEPEILIMDEPTVGIDPHSRNHILETVKSLNKKGMTIVYTSHYMEEVEFLCDRIFIMDKGEIIARGSKEDLIASVNQKERVKVKFNHHDENLLSHLRSLEGLVDLSEEDGWLNLVFDQNNVLKRLMACIQDLPYEIVSMDIEKPNLETVFLNLTGKALRD